MCAALQGSRTAALARGRAAPLAGRAFAGKLVALPTETVYGLAGSARDPQAVARIYAAAGKD